MNVKKRVEYFLKHLHPYVRIARPDHWFKNIFVIPGVLIAAIYTHTPLDVFWVKLVIGLASVCLIASANYVINEWLDAAFDRFHPVKKNRPSVLGTVSKKWVYAEYAMFLAIGLTLAWRVSAAFLYVSISFAAMGLLYNAKPFRTKDRIYMDVLTESVNNAIRLMLGWFIVTASPVPPTSLTIGYWMGGAFLMAVKRFAEYRFIGDPELAGLYRRSFKFYNEERLLISIFFYGLCSAFFLGVFLIKYRIELILSLPFIAFLFVWYLRIGFQKNSSAQEPEYLFREPSLFMYTLFVAAIIMLLLFVDIPALSWLLKKFFFVK